MKYSVSPFSTNRQILSEIYDIFSTKHYMTGFIEIDVTQPRKIIEEHKSSSGNILSFTGWIVYCLGKAIENHKELNSYRYKKNKLVTFEEIDIIVMVERQLNGKTIPTPTSIRNVGKKSVTQISTEIRNAQTKSIDESNQLLDSGWKVKLFPYIPKFIRKFFLNRIIKDPFTIQKQGGLTVVTSVGMFINNYGWFSGFGGITTLNIGVGSVTPKLINHGDDIVEKQVLNMTVSIDHDIVDGGPATRFVSNLIDIMENAVGLQ